MSAEPTIREIGREEWAHVAPLAARAFFDEEFVVGMLGPDPLPRWAGIHGLYADEPFDHAAVHLAAYVDGVVVGAVRASPVGACHVCVGLDPDVRPEDPVQAQEWEFEVQVRRTHEGRGDHAWVSRVVVEPQLQGAGIGARLVDAAVARLAPARVLLECLASREDFYARRGFVRVDEVVDPFAETTYLMQRDAP